jgi:pyruvate dehydrogenase E2 component (dihydrolipoamide acetyltransferase)
VTAQVLTRAQQVIARRMSESRSTVPDFEVRSRVDLQAAMDLRAELKALDPDGAPSVNDLVVKAAALAVREVPRANGAFVDGRWELHERVNVGIAVATDDGLLVPTIFDADRTTVGEIARRSRSLASRARDGAITPAELSGGTFTVSNLGMFGVTGFSPVIFAPQAAILAVGAAVPTPIARDGEIVVRAIAELALACDHRILYGADGARVLARIRELLEQPLRLLAG